MEWCFKCGVSAEKADLYDAISEKGIVKICERCVFQEHMPILKKPAKKQFVPSKPILPKDLSVRMGRDSKTMYDRLSRISGVRMDEKKTDDIELTKQNRVLREVANRNFKEKLLREKGDASDLIEDFHWAIMRTRRGRHISTNQLADAIGEPEIAIRMVEQGTLPRNVIPFIKKIEDYLHIRLIKQGVVHEPLKLSFGARDSMGFKLSDVKTMRPVEEEVAQPEEIEETPDEEIEEPEEDDDVDVRDILFRDSR